MLLKRISLLAIILALEGGFLRCMELPLEAAPKNAKPQGDIQHIDLVPHQTAWAKNQVLANVVLTATAKKKAATANQNLTQKFEQLAIEKKPFPELFHLYMHASDNRLVLMRDSHAQSTKGIRLYGSTEPQPHYVTIQLGMSPKTKESFTSDLTVVPKEKEEKEGRGTTKASSSYPEGCFTYYYTLPNGSEIEFSKGHGIPHADTRIVDSCSLSTKDPENFTPQNEKYNTPARKGLEKRFRDEGLDYKEIAIYHQDHHYKVKIKNAAFIKKKGTDAPLVPIPEGFLLFVFNKQNTVQEAYYFPNFVSYPATANESIKLYRLHDFEQLFVIPYVKAGAVDEQQEKVDLAQELACRILIKAKDFFARYTEEQMPPKARVALLATMLEWNLQAAATLEFVSFANQLTLAYFYIHPQRFPQLDVRTSKEKEDAVTAFLTTPEVSTASKDIVRFLSSRVSFDAMQQLLLNMVQAFGEYWHNAAFLWETPELWPVHYSFKLGEGVHSFNLLHLLRTDIKHIHSLVGGYFPLNVQQAEAIVHIIDRRLQEVGGTVGDILHLIRLFYDYPALSSDQRMKFWEGELEKRVLSSKVTLEELRKIIDFYAYRKNQERKAFYTQKFIEHIEKDKSVENFFDILFWILLKRATFLQNLNEYASDYNAATYLGYQICKGLLALKEEIGLGQEIIETLQQVSVNFEMQLGLDKSDLSDLKKNSLLRPSGLNPLLSYSDGELNVTGKLIRKISEIFYGEFCPLILEKLLVNAGKGDADAQCAVGHWLCKEGRDSDARTYFVDAANHGHVRAQYLHALLYRQGRGVDKSDE